MPVSPEQAALRASVCGLFPTLDSLEAVLELGQSQLPIATPNELVCLLMTMQNTVLHIRAKDEQS